MDAFHKFPYEGDDDFFHDGVVQSVASVEFPDVAAVPLGELIPGTGVEDVIPCSEESPAQPAVRIVQAVELVVLHLLEMLDDLGSDGELSLAGCRGLEIVKGSDLEDGIQSGQAQGRVDADSSETPHLLGVHAAMLVPMMTRGHSFGSSP